MDSSQVARVTVHEKHVVNKDQGTIDLIGLDPNLYGSSELRGIPAGHFEIRAPKMAKSRGNIISPDTIVAEYGADSLRLYEMFMGPLEAVKPWSMKGVEGVYRFLGRAWRMIVDAEADVLRLDHRVSSEDMTLEQ